MPKLDLPNQNWALVREADEIPRKAARAYRKVLYGLATGSDIDPTGDQEAAARAVAAEMLKSGDTLEGMEDMADALVFAAVSEWSYGEVDADTLDNVPDAAVDAIFSYAINEGYMEKLMPDFGVSPDDDSPTGPSGR